MRNPPHFHVDLLSELHCPYCASSLAVDLKVEEVGAGIRHGVVRCRCYRYPIIEGILAMRQEGPHRLGMFARATAALDRGDVRSALMEVLPLPGHTRLERGLSALARLGVKPGVVLHRARTGRIIDTLLKEDTTLAEAVQLLQIPSYADYLIHRYANPSFLAAIPLILLLELVERRAGSGANVLDLACGSGHSSYLISKLFPSLRLFSIDHDFANLFIVKRYSAPESNCLCLDLQLPLPFADDAAAGAFCLDAFHYINAKTAFLEQVDRVCAADALWIFPHLHNLMHEVPTPGIPLEPVDYARLFARKAGTLLDERKLLEDFVAGGLDLVTPRDLQTLAAAPNLSFVGGLPSDYAVSPEELTQYLLRAAEDFTINPLFETEPGQEGLKLTERWPNPHLEHECAEVKDFVPSSFEVPNEIIAGFDPSSTQLESVRSLLLQFIVVPLPPRYGAGVKLAPGYAR